MMNRHGARLLACTVCLVLIASVTAGGGGKQWHTQPCSNYNPHLPPCPPCSMPPCSSPSPQPSSTSAYAYISSQADLSALKGVIDELGLQSALSGSFGGTVFAPNNAALVGYTGRFLSNVSYETDAGKQFLDLFFGKLLSYHTLSDSVSASQLATGTVYSTGYTSINGNPHTVAYSGSGLLDEQQQTVGLTGTGSAVSGGGYVHIINGVLQPNDIFPSLTAALTSSSEFSKLLEVVQKINSGLEMNLVDMLENIAGTIAVPNNQAFDGVDISAIDAQTLLNVVTYHFCAFTRYYRLLFTPFVQGQKPGKNPCLTILSRAMNMPYGLAWHYNSPLDIGVSYATGQLPDNLEMKNSSIVLADLSFPTHSAQVISSLLMPPTQATNSTKVKSAAQATQKVVQTLERLSNMHARSTPSGTNTKKDAKNPKTGGTNPKTGGTRPKTGGTGDSKPGGARNRKTLDPRLAELDARP